MYIKKILRNCLHNLQCMLKAIRKHKRILRFRLTTENLLRTDTIEVYFSVMFFIIFSHEYNGRMAFQLIIPIDDVI